MNNILLDIELQLQELGPVIRSGVYSHLEAFVPCNKETLVKRLKKLHLNVQDDRLREPLQKLKLAVSNVMPEQLFKYQEDCQARSQAKCAKLQADEEREKMDPMMMTMRNQGSESSAHERNSTGMTPSELCYVTLLRSNWDAMN